MVVDLSSSYEGVPPSDPQLLALRATCARAAHIPGAAKFLGELGLGVGGASVLALADRLLGNLMSPSPVILGVE